MIFIFHLILAVILFLIINWIGKHSFSIGYVQMSIFQKDEEAPAFNYLYRILSPTVYIIIISTILYKLSLDNYAKNIYLIPIYYVVFRQFFNLVTNRALLINWTRVIVTDLAIITLAYLVYSKIIITKQNLMPDFSTFAEEMWIIIAVFIYQVLNKVELSKSATINRKNNYINKRFLKFKSKYHSVLTEQINNDKLIATVYSIMIYEDFNRPKIIRIIENIAQKIGSKPRSLGIMQVTSNKSISDDESVVLAIEKIKRHYFQIPEIIKENKENSRYHSYNDNDELQEWEIEREILKNYNPDDDYINEVSDLIEIMSEKLNCANSKYKFENKAEA